jgi:hypothetical protein
MASELASIMENDSRGGFHIPDMPANHTNMGLEVAVIAEDVRRGVGPVPKLAQKKCWRSYFSM